MSSFKVWMLSGLGLVLAVGIGFGAYHLGAAAKETAKPAPKPAAPADAKPADAKPADAKATDAKSADAKTDKPVLWGKSCQAAQDGKQVCAVVQNVVITDKATKASARALTVAVGYPAPDGKLRMALTLPLGINLPAGVSFQIDEGKSNTLPVETCLADGCRIVMVIDDTGRDSLVKSKLIRVTYQLANGQKLALPIELAGFGDALAQLTP